MELGFGRERARNALPNIFFAEEGSYTAAMPTSPGRAVLSASFVVVLGCAETVSSSPRAAQPAPAPSASIERSDLTSGPDPAFAGLQFPLTEEAASTPFQKVLAQKMIARFRAAGLSVGLPKDPSEGAVSVVESLLNGPQEMGDSGTEEFSYSLEIQSLIPNRRCF